MDLGRDDGVRVDLRIVGSRRRLAERGDHQPVRVGMQPAAITADASGGPEPLEVLERGGDGDVVGFEQAFVVGQRPPYRQ